MFDGMVINVICKMQLDYAFIFFVEGLSEQLLFSKAPLGID